MSDMLSNGPGGFYGRGKTMRTIQYINTIKSHYHFHSKSKSNKTNKSNDNNNNDNDTNKDTKNKKSGINILPTLKKIVALTNDNNNNVMNNNIELTNTQLSEMNINNESNNFDDYYNSFLLTFKSKERERQFHFYLTQRYSTSILISLLLIIFAYILIALTDESFTKSTLQIVFVCFGLFIMTFVFIIASLYSTESLSNTASYVMSLFKHKNQTPSMTDFSNNIKNQLNTKKVSHLSIILYDIFGGYSHYLACICAICLLLLLIFQNTLSQSLSNDKFILFYILSLIIISGI